MAKQKPPADEGLDSLLGALDAMVVPEDTPAADDLDSLLDDLGSFDAPDADGEPEPGEPGEAPPPPRKRWRPTRLMLILTAGALASHAALFGLGYWLGGKFAPHEVAHGGEAQVAPLEGVLRHVGHPADLRVDGHLIFTTPEVREAVLELDGGQALADAMEKFAQRVKSLGPVTRDGDVLEARACNPQACGAEAYTLRYNSHTHQVWVCQTVPFSGGNSLSYLYGADGMEEVARCIDQTPLPQSKAESPEAPPQEPEPSPAPVEGKGQLARPGRAPPAAEHSAVD